MEITVKIDCPALDRLAQMLEHLPALHPNGGYVPPVPQPETPAQQPEAPTAIEARAVLSELRSKKNSKVLREAVFEPMGVKSFTDLKTPEDLARAVELAREAMA